MLSFSVPRLTADRLARLCLASADDNSNIAHYGIRVAETQVRFSATNGRILASLIVPITDLLGDPTDLILDQAQFAAALKAVAKGSGGRISLKIDDTEARVTNGTVASVVRRITGTFPNVDHVWTRPAGLAWVPAMSSQDPMLLGIAQKIAGAKSAMLFSSPVEPDVALRRLWSSPGREDRVESVGVAALRKAVVAPAYWCDFELAILVMPITRSSEDRQLDLTAHAMQVPRVAALAA